MATESDVSQSAEALRANMQGLTQTTGDLAAKQSALASATSAAYNSLRGFSSSMASGRAELQNLNQIYEVMGQAVGRTSRIIGELGSKIPYIGGVFSAIGQLGAEAANVATGGLKFLNTQLNTTIKQFQTFGTIGALGAQGMSGLRDQMISSGMTMEGFQQAVMANSQTLAAFAGTTSEGAKKFSEIVGAITTQPIGAELRNIGLSADMIGEAAAAFLAREQRQGRVQGASQEQLTRGAIAYAKELDILARLTGQSADQLRRQQDAAMSESRFRASIYELDAEAQKRLLAAQSMFAKAPQVAQGIRDLVSGVTNTDAALKLVSLTGGEAADAVERLKAGQINEFQFREEMNAMLRMNIKNFADNAKYADGVSEAYGDFAQVLDVINENVGGVKEASDQQKKLSQGQDALTQSTVSAQAALENLSRVVMRIVSQLMPFAAQITQSTVSGMVTAINQAGQFGGFPRLNEQGNLAGAGANPAAGAAPAFIQQNAAALGGVMGNRPPVDFGNRLPPPQMQFAPPGNPQDLLQFEGTNLQSFQQLDSNMQAAILSAAQDFYRDTGQKLRISSAFRTREQQEALWNNRQNNSYPVAPPGTSRHEHGQAVDILNFQAAERYLRQQGLYRPDPGGDRIHFEPAGRGDANGISAPRGGYTPTLDGNFSMTNGNENRTNQQSMTNNNVLEEQLIKLDRIATATERQAQLAQQMLSYAS